MLPPLVFVNPLQFFLDPSVPEVEGDIQLLALAVKFRRAHRKLEFAVALVVYNLEREAAEPEVFFFGVLGRRICFQNHADILC